MRNSFSSCGSGGIGPEIFFARFGGLENLADPAIIAKLSLTSH
jgi:hypothetical protein